MKLVSGQNDLTSKRAIELVSNFLLEWSDVNPDDVKLTKLTGGYCNTVWLCRRCDGNNNNSTDAETLSEVVLRFYGGNILDIFQEEVPQVLSIEGQLIVAHHMSITGLGPKLYGIFDDGRVEEFIDGHTLKPEDAKRSDIKRDIAIAMARIHSFDIPISKKYVSRIDCLFTHDTTLLCEMIEAARDAFRISDAVKQLGVDAEEILSVDVMSEINWIREMREKVTSRNVFMIRDANFLNTLVRSYPTKGQLKVSLIDYEDCCYTSRGVHIGAHFANRVISWDDRNDKFTGGSVPYPDEDDRREFIEEYLKETKRLNYYEMDHEKIDSVEHLLVESEIGSMHVYFTLFSNFLECFEEILKMESSDESSFVKMIPGLLRAYMDRKKEFLARDKE